MPEEGSFILLVDFDDQRRAEIVNFLKRCDFGVLGTKEVDKPIFDAIIYGKLSPNAIFCVVSSQEHISSFNSWVYAFRETFPAKSSGAKIVLVAPDPILFGTDGLMAREVADQTISSCVFNGPHFSLNYIKEILAS